MMPVKISLLLVQQFLVPAGWLGGGFGLGVRQVQWAGLAEGGASEDVLDLLDC